MGISSAAISLTPDVEVGIDVAASPQRVWELVSDITAMPRWSPETCAAPPDG